MENQCLGTKDERMTLVQPQNQIQAQLPMYLSHPPTSTSQL